MMRVRERYSFIALALEPPVSRCLWDRDNICCPTFCTDTAVTSMPDSSAVNCDQPSRPCGVASAKLDVSAPHEAALLAAGRTSPELKQELRWAEQALANRKAFLREHRNESVSSFTGYEDA